MEWVVKDGGVLVNYMGRKFLHGLNCKGAVLSEMDTGWLIVKMANVNAEDGIEIHQWVKLKLWLGMSYDYEAEFTFNYVRGFDILLGKS